MSTPRVQTVTHKAILYRANGERPAFIGTACRGASNVPMADDVAKVTCKRCLLAVPKIARNLAMADREQETETMKPCECEHILHFHDEQPDSGCHPHGERFADLYTVKTPWGTFAICHACRAHGHCS